MGKTAMSDAFKNYLKSTTLHGFKYLCSAYYIDRLGWIVCCAASACCAGVLCAVLWARFLEVPALLTLSNNINNDEFMEKKMPAIILCPTTENVAEMFLEKLSPNQTEEQRIPTIIARILTGKFIDKHQLLLLDEFLTHNNVSLSEIMVHYAPSCSDHTKRCRYQQTVIPCDKLFEREVTTSGICCRFDPKKLENITRHFEPRTHTTQMLDLVLQYTQGPTNYGCQLWTMYENEEDNGPDSLLPGTFYMAYQKFIVVTKPASDNLMTSSCVDVKGYSKTSCMLKCAEVSCGCRDPLYPPQVDEQTAMLPTCPVTRLQCVRKIGNNMSCNCLPPCNRIRTSLVLDSSVLNVQHTLDPFFMGLNTTSSIVIKLRVNLAHSRKFLPIPTDTWVTLLSSLGGVFNMFLGVGLFSALEFLFLIIIKLPTALRKSSEIVPIAPHTTPLPHQNHYRYNYYSLYPYRLRPQNQNFVRVDPFKPDRTLRY